MARSSCRLACSSLQLDLIQRLIPWFVRYEHILSLQFALHEAVMCRAHSHHVRGLLEDSALVPSGPAIDFSIIINIADGRKYRKRC